MRAADDNVRRGNTDGRGAPILLLSWVLPAPIPVHCVAGMHFIGWVSFSSDVSGSVPRQQRTKHPARAAAFRGGGGAVLVR